ncbi:sigma 54-interacting transcriptional regulator [Sporomusa sphaeroides]|uniref:HTH-type transcriptional regulatory protein TyrR n=1 Tax=Sporomusa sphaeroides DSM 2875 TaxID=1337886 RepID=A0ABM9W9R2_9FIRM|nr:sigma 54-interacting transcriptional regulator [Sporomusa sphaeroides]OLS55790.1 transcriptional regulatory protein TyrR [Sporomusa sphaeroides DSM 2875]CVK21837.1 Transcriptional regulatory protein TyrR [Sporomusa sphaeroides DSM 2875]
MRIKIPNIDRVGLVFDIARVLAAQHINIISMEVDLEIVYLETAPLSEENILTLFDKLRTIPDILDIVPVDLMPHQEKAEQLAAVLAAANDGILAIDRHGRITQYNPAAAKIMHIPCAEALGRELLTVFPYCHSLMESMKKGLSYTNREMFVEETNSHYLVSSRPLLDQSGEITGAMAILKDIRDVRKLFQQLTEQPAMTFQEILHRSKSMRQVIALAKAYARGGSTVLIRGETGTGKELFARALHAASPRADNIFVPVNCAAIPDTLLESELFGYEEGAFTGAVKGGKQGLFELANSGTLFLDEIGETSSHLQAKLLRVLQDRKVRRIGSSREIAVDVRILAATNRNLEDMIAGGTFREDLYYRLNVIPLFLPPLRERREDIPLLVDFFLRRFSTKLHKQVDTVSETALQKLCAYTWPGNIRELENVIERAVNIVTGPTLLTDHIILQHSAPAAKVHLPVLHHTLEEALEETERELLCRAMRQFHTSRQIGKMLGLSHTTVLKKLRKHGLSLNHFTPA